MLSLRRALILVAAVLANGACAQTPSSSPVYVPPWAEAAGRLVNPPANAVLSPDGRRAAWAEGRSLFSATRATGDAGTSAWAAPDRLLTIRGSIGHIRFSPDGKSIAFENPRTWLGNGAEHDRWSFIAVHDIAARQTNFVDPSFDRDSDPVWSADSNSISFTRSVPGLPDKRLTRPVTRLKQAGWQPPSQRPQERFTMASVLAAPYLYPPTGSADGTAVAYVSREAQSRNLYVLRAGQPARRLVAYGGDDGQEVAVAPAISAHGGAIAYVRGSRANKQGDHADPLANPDLPAQQVWLIGSDGTDSPRLLGQGSSALFTPDEGLVLWKGNGHIMAAALNWEGGRLTGVGAPFEFLAGDRRDMRFSPDGSKLAYVRGDGVEILDLASKTALVIPHGTAADAGPVWSPDGQSLAFRREPATSPNLAHNLCGQSRSCGPVLSDDPWSIWTVTVAAPTQPRKIWQASAGPGSVFYALDQSYAPIMQGAQMAWTPAGDIVFANESDGWRHLYSVPASGGTARLLTPGDGEVEYFSTSIDGSSLVYATNIGDLGRRHIAQVAADGRTPPVALTSGEGNQWTPVPLAGGAVAYVDSDWAHPQNVVVLSAAGAITSAAFPAIPAGFPGDRLVQPQLIEFPASDGQTAFGQLFVPAKPTGCAIVFAHGGIRRQMLTSYHYMDAYHYLYGMNQYLAGRGCVVLSVEYRSSIMRGFEFRNPPGWGFAGNSEIKDVVGAAKWLKRHFGKQAANGIGIYGLSWGGYITATALAKHSDIFSVGFDMAGVHFTQDTPGMAYSPIGLIEGWKSPIFIAQGDDDMNVNINDGIALSYALQRQKPQVEYRQQVLPGQTHDLYLTFEQLVQIYTDGSDWLISHLSKRR